MTSIAIYVEGGGDSEAGKAALRQGFDGLFAAQKRAACARKMRWKTVLCGGRNATFDAFVSATTRRTADVVVLVVDAEDAVTAPAPAGRVAPLATPMPAARVAHLAARDGWRFDGVVAERVHLMTQCMEAWIVADPETLATFYGKGFHAKALPKRAVLDDEPKAALYAALASATKDTQKGSYGKIKHASELLKRIRPDILATRCISFRQLARWLDAAIASS